jgi:hypothetical protein
MKCDIYTSTSYVLNKVYPTHKESGKPVKSRLSALLKVIARGGLEPEQRTY